MEAYNCELMSSWAQSSQSTKLAQVLWLDKCQEPFHPTVKVKDLVQFLGPSAVKPQTSIVLGDLPQGKWLSLRAAAAGWRGSGTV